MNTVYWKLLSEDFGSSEFAELRSLRSWMHEAAEWCRIWEFSFWTTEREVPSSPASACTTQSKDTEFYSSTLFEAEQEVDLSRTTTKPRQLSTKFMYHWVTAEVFCWTELPTTFDFDLHQPMDEADLLKSKRTPLSNLFWLTFLIEGLWIQ